jgi:hypothetical protein
MPESGREGGQQDAAARHSVRQTWLWRVLHAAKIALPTPPPTYADELRGVRLLKENLTAEQLTQYERDMSFIVIGGATGQRYRIIAARQMNVAALGKDGGWVKSLCFVPCGQLPLGDIMLAQKIALELFEHEALSTAHRPSPPFYRVGAF